MVASSRRTGESEGSVSAATKASTSMVTATSMSVKPADARRLVRGAAHAKGCINRPLPLPSLEMWRPAKLDLSVNQCQIMTHKSAQGLQLVNSTELRFGAACRSRTSFRDVHPDGRPAGPFAVAVVTRHFSPRRTAVPRRKGSQLKLSQHYNQPAARFTHGICITKPPPESGRSRLASGRLVA